MRLLRLAFLASLALPPIMRFAKAATIVATGKGEIDGSDTIDKYGLFGQAHQNLRGAPFSYRVRYESDQYGPAINCGTSCMYYDSVPGANQRAANISITVNGKTLSFNARKSGGQVEFYEMDVCEVSVGAYRVALTKNGAKLEFYTNEEDSFTELARREISMVTKGNVVATDYPDARLPLGQP